MMLLTVLTKPASQMSKSTVIFLGPETVCKLFGPEGALDQGLFVPVFLLFILKWLAPSLPTNVPLLFALRS